MIGGKAAPGYEMAKRIIKLVSAVADKVGGGGAGAGVGGRGGGPKVGRCVLHAERLRSRVFQAQLRRCLVLASHAAEAHVPRLPSVSTHHAPLLPACHRSTTTLTLAICSR